MQILKRRCIVLENEDGKCWIVDGKLHREDGPAIECTNGNKAWFLKGKQYSKEEYELHKYSNTTEATIKKVRARERFSFTEIKEAFIRMMIG